MTEPLYVRGGGAVTPVGLDARQTCAAIRGRVANFRRIVRSQPFGTNQFVARVPAHWKLRSVPAEWLVNLAARAVKEIIDRHRLNVRETALILIPPEPFRHDVFENNETVGSLAGLVARKIDAHFSSAAQIATGGAASLVAGLRHAARLLTSGEATHVIVGGVDTYVLDEEYARLETAGRLRTEGTAQGLTPGEGAAFALLSAHPPANGERSTAIFGVGDAAEPDTALSDHQSQGRAMLAALKTALAEGGAQESSLGWVISNANGERYGALESLVTRARFYRTRREIMPTTYPAMSVGETGSASGTLALLVATHGFVRGYAPSKLAMIELSSEGPGRAACLVAAVGRGGPTGE